MSENDIKTTAGIIEYKKEYMKEYRIKNKDKLREYIKCEVCDSYYKRENKTHHLKTKKHITNELLKRKMDQVQELQNKINQVQDLQNKMSNIINVQ